MSRAAGTFVCCQAAFGKAVPAFQLTALSTRHFFRESFLVGFSPTLPACTDARIIPQFKFSLCEMPSTIELRPNRRLLDHEFEGYKLNLQSLPHWTHDLEESVDKLYPDELQYSFLHTRLFALHNHLIADYWDHHYSFYYIDKKQQVRKIYFNSDNHSFTNVVVYDVPAHVQRKSGHFNLCLSFPASNIAVISDGTGYLHIVSTENRTNTDQKWQTVYSSLALGENNFFVIIDTRVHEKNSKIHVHCLLQSIEQLDSHFCSVLTLLTFENNGNVWKQTNLKQLQGKGIIHYAAIETNCAALYVASDNQFKFTKDSEKDIESIKKEEEPKKIIYTWMQTMDDITVTLKLGPNYDKNLLHVFVSPVLVKVSYAGNIFVDGKMVHKVDSELTTWNVQEDGQVDILITKSDSMIWDGFLVGGDIHGQEILDPSLVEETHKRLAHLCSESLVTADHTVSAVSTQELEECDAASEEDTVLVRWDITHHEITHRIPLSVHQYIFSITIEAREVPAIALRHDVDACIWQPYAKLPDMNLWPTQHQGTLMAFGYVQSSKQNRKFVTCPSNFSYGVVCESSRHVFIYRSNNISSENCQLRQRSPGGATKRVKIGHQYVFNIDQYGEVLGINATNEYLFLLTDKCMVVVQVM
ncbi:NudC domain-containing protein 1 [Eumeta japonica]|uniref:NudC domain-containing protein 1 n=1 Tax=Eumeta variegata TaxID=151549 RepID=A0A4C1ZBJ3_EUMVA|nr:NudC domain-containing protein 1 [Eumeta japonica]